MKTNELKRYYNQHCRFKLRSGKEVFGVLWEVDANGHKQVYFASAKEHRDFVESRNQHVLSNSASVDLEEIIHAEKMTG